MILLLFLLSQFSLSTAQIVHPHYVEQFKKIKYNADQKEYTAFIDTLKKNNIQIGECVEQFIVNKKERALNDPFFNDNDRKEIKSLDEYHKRIDNKKLEIIYQDSIPSYIRKLVQKTAEELGVKERIEVAPSLDSVGSIFPKKWWDDKDFNKIPHKYKILGVTTCNLLLSKEFIIDNFCQDCMIMRDINCRCRQIRAAAIRHELTHIKKRHFHINFYDVLINKKINPELKAKITRSIETEADLLPLAYGNKGVAQDAVVEFEFIYNNICKSDEQFSQNDPLSAHSSLMKRISRAIVIRRLKQEEFKQDHPVLHQFDKIKPGIVKAYYWSYFFLATLTCYFMVTHLIFENFYNANKNHADILEAAKLMKEVLKNPEFLLNKN